MRRCIAFGWILLWGAAAMAEVRYHSRATGVPAPPRAAGVEQNPMTIRGAQRDRVALTDVDHVQLHVAARERRPRLKALFTSGYSAPVLQARGTADQGVPLLGKPYRKQKLAETIRAVLDGG